MKVTIERRPRAPADTAGTSRNGIITFIGNHDLAAYYVLTFAISWGGILLLAGPAGMFSTGSSMPVSGGVALTAGPAVAGILLTGLVDGRAGLRRLGTRLRRWRVGGRWYVVALVTGPLVMGSTALVLSLASPDLHRGFATVEGMSGIVLAGMALGLVVGFFEELGWTGFALPRWRRRHGILATGLVMGLLWGVWHFPMFAGSADPSGTVPAAVLVAVFLLSWLPPYRVLIAWAYDRTQSLLIAILMHAPISATAFILASVASETAAGIALLTPALGWGVAFWLIIAMVALGNGGRLTERRRRSSLGGQLGRRLERSQKTSAANQSKPVAPTR